MITTRRRLALLFAGIAGSSLLAGTADAQSIGIVIAPSAPPPMRYEPMPPPRPGYTWTRGYWDWNGRAYGWREGRWVRARPGYVWTEPTWYQDGRGWRRAQGRWDMDRRGPPPASHRGPPPRHNNPPPPPPRHGPPPSRHEPPPPPPRGYR